MDLTERLSTHTSRKVKLFGSSTTSSAVRCPSSMLKLYNIRGSRDWGGQFLPIITIYIMVIIVYLDVHYFDQVPTTRRRLHVVQKVLRVSLFSFLSFEKPKISKIWNFYFIEGFLSKSECCQSEISGIQRKELFTIKEIISSKGDMWKILIKCKTDILCT